MPLAATVGIALSIPWRAPSGIVFEMPAHRSGPVFGARHDDVADRIFYVVILVPVEGVLPRQRKLHLGVAARRQWMRPQIVAAEQRIAPVCAARPAHMEMCGSHVGGWTIVQLAPVVASGRRRRNVVMVNICGAATADTSE